MSLYNYLVQVFGQFIGIFPPALQWLVTLLVVIGIIGALIAALRHYLLFLIVLVVLVPFLVPAITRLVGEIYAFVVYLLHFLKLTSPKS